MNIAVQKVSGTNILSYKLYLNYTKLLLGVDIGGLGTLIASLASLISFQFYRKAEKAQTGRYILVFTAVNIVILAVLIVLELILGNI